MGRRSFALCALFALLVLCARASAWGGGGADGGAVSLDDVRSLTFRAGDKTNARRVAPVDAMTVRRRADGRSCWRV